MLFDKYINILKYTIMKFRFTIIFLASIFIVHSQELVQNSATVKFKIKNMGFNVDGQFKKAAISSNFDADNLENSFINGIIQVNAIDTNNKKRDKHLLSDDYFEASTYHNIRLKSTKIVRTSANKYQLMGNLTIKKTTKQIVIPLVVAETNAVITIKSKFSIDRLDYNVGDSSWVLSDTVKLNITYTAKK